VRRRAQRDRGHRAVCVGEKRRIAERCARVAREAAQFACECRSAHHRAEHAAEARFSLRIDEACDFCG